MQNTNSKYQFSCTQRFVDSVQSSYKYIQHRLNSLKLCKKFPPIKSLALYNPIKNLWSPPIPLRVQPHLDRPKIVSPMSCLSRIYFYCRARCNHDLKQAAVVYPGLPIQLPFPFLPPGFPPGAGTEHMSNPCVCSGALSLYQDRLQWLHMSFYMLVAKAKIPTILELLELFHSA